MNNTLLAKLISESRNPYLTHPDYQANPFLKYFWKYYQSLYDWEAGLQATGHPLNHPHFYSSAWFALAFLVFWCLCLYFFAFPFPLDWDETTDPRILKARARRRFKTDKIAFSIVYIYSQIAHFPHFWGDCDICCFGTYIVLLVSYYFISKWQYKKRFGKEDEEDRQQKERAEAAKNKKKL